MNTEHKSNTKESIKDLWRTPQKLFDYYNRRFNFNIDMAASDENALCEAYFTESDSVFSYDFGHNWKEYPAGNTWLNPPFSNITPWIEKVLEISFATEDAFVVLLPADTSVKWFKLAFDNCTECHFISGRLAFINEDTKKPVSGNNKGSVVFIFDPKSPIKQAVSLIDRDEIMNHKD